MPSEITVYECDVCRLQYQTEKAAKVCEDTHNQPASYIPLYQKSELLPYGIKATFTDGSVIEYYNEDR